MKFFEGKTKSERNKTIAAIALGAACLVVLFFAFGRGAFSGGSNTAAAKPSPTPKNNSTAKSPPGGVKMPSTEDQELDMTTQPIVYNRALYGAPDPGRNIFAFYEPAKATPTPVPLPVIKTPEPATPTPPPDIQIAVINPQSVYAGSNGFRLDIAGDRFTPDTKIYFEQQELPTTFVSAQRVTADIPSVLIRGEGSKRLIAQTADGTKHSNQVTLEIQPPPKPTFTYIGMIARKRSNNDTAYFKEPNRELPISARLNDVVSGRFRVLSISAEETILEDVSLGFKHKLPLYNPPAAAATGQPTGPGGGQPGRGGFPGRETYTPMNPNPPQGGGGTNSRIPGIPDNIPRYIPPGQNNSNRVPSNTKQDVDDDDGID